MSNQSTKDNLTKKLWWSNILCAIIMLISIGMLIASPFMNLDNAYEAIWATTFTSSFNALRVEAGNLLSLFIKAYAKKKGVSLDDKNTK